MKVSDQILAAYVDGEMGEEDLRRVAEAIAGDADLRARADLARDLRARLTDHFAPVLDEPLPERLTRLIRSRPEPAGEVVDLAPARANRPALRRPAPWRMAAAMAATLLIGLAVGRFSLWAPEADVVSDGGALTAHGALALSLSTQLASDQSPGAQIRIGLTFHDTADQLCRTFSSRALDGLACWTGDRWKMRVTSARAMARPTTDYHQAASEDPLILQAAQALMKGGPLDAPAERFALQKLAHKRT